MGDGAMGFRDRKNLMTLVQGDVIGDVRLSLEQLSPRKWILT